MGKTDCQKICLNILNAWKHEVKTLCFICSQLFCDFGEEFEVLDRDGETPASAIIERISKVIHSIQNLLLLLRALSGNSHAYVQFIVARYLTCMSFDCKRKSEYAQEERTDSTKKAYFM